MRVNLLHSWQLMDITQTYKNQLSCLANETLWGWKGLSEVSEVWTLKWRTDEGGRRGLKVRASAGMNKPLKDLRRKGEWREGTVFSKFSKNMNHTFSINWLFHRISQESEPDIFLQPHINHPFTCVSLPQVKTADDGGAFRDWGLRKTSFFQSAIHSFFA